MKKLWVILIIAAFTGMVVFAQEAENSTVGILKSPSATGFNFCKEA